MRRRDKEIRDIKAIEDIIARSTVCRLALADGDRPYVVPLNFGHQDKKIYFHSAPIGRKIDIIKKNNKVCVLFDVDQEIDTRGEKACKWSTRYRSVIGFGTAEIITNDTEKINGLDVIMNQYAAGPFEYSAKAVSECVIIKVDIDYFTGKSSGY
jgi:nitroimidazol reductase NimA-like FMN-containing flavoprotein (pyridoxamine 5'-phosphate oxidase superfamily)